MLSILVFKATLLAPNLANDGLVCAALCDNKEYDF